MNMWCITRDASPSTVTSWCVLPASFDELNIAKCVVIQLALLGNLTIQMEEVTIARSCLQPNKVCVAHQDGKTFLHATEQCVFSIRCRKWLHGLPNNITFLACGLSETRRWGFLPDAPFVRGIGASYWKSKSCVVFTNLWLMLVQWLVALMTYSKSDAIFRNKAAVKLTWA
jgi:hypothetical protein